MKKIITTMFILIHISCNNSINSNRINTIESKYTLLNSFNDKKEEREIEFKIKRGLPVVKLKLNGRDANFLIDTGATSSVLNMGSANYYGFSYRIHDGSYFTGANGAQIRSGFIHGAKLYDGDSEIEIRFKAIDIQKVSIEYGIAGVLGTDFLLRTKANVDYNEKLLIIRQ